ncbi:hypothetical protein BC349_03340 [Flavihumibacter stibioxidans]|uniref:CCDC81-like prokaryotic HU domain-containing protein n=1 Tax=Flavihumibacter stibioxidans TaxID=1834163 RepID=A0ABR7M4Q6_9BACT|nr:hypothetical protein [Flavihumibacter stibioxidans]
MPVPVKSVFLPGLSPHFYMEILNSYLYQQKSISIPGLGTLHMERMPARTDFVNRRLLPPGFNFRFDKYFDAPGKDFFGYIAAKKQIPDFEAIKWYNEFAFDLRTKIRNKEKAEWPELGYFQADENGEIFFEAKYENFPVLPAVDAVRILRENAEHHLLVGDVERTNTEMPEILTGVFVEKASWWIYVIIIAALALSICFYHFYRNGTSFGSTGNHQSIPARTMPATSR